MLPAANRLRRSTDFAAATRSHLRAGGSVLVIHLLAPDQADATTSVRVGFVVSKAVGGSVQRHRIARQLRAITAPHLTRLPAGSRVVVRALAPAATATFAEMTTDFAGALERVLRKAERMVEASSSRTDDSV